MKITRDLLIRLKACQQGLDLLEKYPDGATLIELAKDPDLTLEDCYFARHYFNLNEEELKLYNQICQIEDCGDHVLRSSQIKNSAWVYNSTAVKDSSYVSRSESISECKEIVNTINADQSENVINSKNINYSKNVAESDNIACSHNIINSSYINWSNVINSCYELEDCAFVYKSHNSRECYFCGFVEDSNHCLFCNNISNAAYQIFNKEVSVEEFEQTKEILLLQLQAENVDLLNINEFNLSSLTIFIIKSFDLFIHFIIVSKTF